MVGDRVVGCFVGLAVGNEVVGLLVGEAEGCVVGFALGDSVGGVGAGVAQAPLSQLHASFAHSGLHTFWGPSSTMNGEQPGAQSIVCVNC